ncbi:MAG: non-hydrolyzing UDP-N-acetylglucosamine 2-epimerase [Bacillota bacterium]
MKIAVIVGTRPELIKMAVIIKELKKRDSSHLFIHSGQHYDYQMDGMVSDLFQLPEPDYNFAVGSGSHASTTASILLKMEEIILKEKIDKIVVHGDTNTTLAASLAAAKTLTPIAHVEAGLRSYDKTMPEEINRILVDNLSTYLFCPTHEAVSNLKKEGIKRGLHLTGQTIVDAVDYIRNRQVVDVLETYNLRTKEFIFMTVHRQENTDSPDRLASIISAIEDLARQDTFKLVFAMHPRTKKILMHHDMYQRLLHDSNILLIDPSPTFYETIHLQHHAKLILTDSGGLQEESCIMGTPCVTLRENTERPETVECGANIIAGYHKHAILQAVQDSLSKNNGWTHPYGQVGVSNQIIDIILN